MSFSNLSPNHKFSTQLKHRFRCVCIYDLFWKPLCKFHNNKWASAELPRIFRPDVFVFLKYRSKLPHSFRGSSAFTGESKNINFLHLPPTFRGSSASRANTYIYFRRPSADLPPVGRTLISHFRWASADLPPVARSKKLIKILVLPHTFRGSSAHMLGLLCRLCCPVFLTLLGNLCLESLVIDNYN